MSEVLFPNESDELSDCSKFPLLANSAVKESQRWIESLTGNEFKYPCNIIQSLQDGVLLCRLVNALKPGCVKRINQMQTPVAFLDNLSVFQASCREEFGLQEAQLFDIRDLDDLDIRGTLDSEDEINRETSKRIRNILVTVYWLGKVARPLRPNVALNFEPFKGLVDPSHFAITSTFSSASSEVSSTAHESTNERRPEFPSPAECIEEITFRRKEEPTDAGADRETKFAEWKTKKMKQRDDPDDDQILSDGGTTREWMPTWEQTRSQPITMMHRAQFHEEDFDDDDDDAEAPAPPNWKTFPGGQGILYLGDLKYLDEGEDAPGSIPYPDTSSSSSASSFTTKQFSDGTQIFAETTRVPRFLSTTSALLAVSPDVPSSDEVSKDFDNLLEDVENLMSVSKSQSLQYLEDFDEVGFEAEVDPSYEDVKNEAVATGTPVFEEGENINAGDDSLDKKLLNEVKRSGRKGSDFLEELADLEEATKKYDVSSESPDKYSEDCISSVVSPEVPTLASFNHCSSDETSHSTQKFHSTILDRFPQDLGSVLKVDTPNMSRRSFDLEGERRRMEDWNRKVEGELKEKFQKDQEMMEQILKEDLKKAHQVERMKQLLEEKFLEEEEVIELKNKKSFSGEERLSKFSKSSLSLFSSPIPIRGRSPHLPTDVESLTDDWLRHSFSGDDDKLSDAEKTYREVFADRERFDEAFEEPKWMVFESNRVDRIVVDAPINKATIEMLPDSLSSSNESLDSVSPRESQESLCIGDNKEDGILGDPTAVLGVNWNAAINTFETPPIPERDDSLLVASDILTSRQQATYLSFDASIANFAKSSSTTIQPPTSLHLPLNHSPITNLPVNHTPVMTTVSSDGLLTPSSDRCSETCKYIPPQPITPYKRTSSLFPTPRTTLAERPDHLLIEASHPDGSQPQKSIDYLFAYHNDQLKCRYYWSTSPVPINQVSPKELLSYPKLGSPINRPEGVSSCSGCGYCLATEQSIDIYTLSSWYHPECFKCQQCDVPLNSDNATIYQSSPHCSKCFTQLSQY